MKHIARLTALCCAFLLIVSPSQAATYLEIENNTLWVQGYRIELDETKTPPVVLRQIDGEVRATVQSRQGEVELVLSPGTILLSENAHDHVADYRVHPEPSSEAPDAAPRIPARNECRYCGLADPASQNHTCPRCHTPYCIHDDLKCSYRLNPVPTPVKYIDAQGRETTQGISADGSTMINHPYNSQALKDPQGWEPGKAYEKANATPSPSPDLPDGVPVLTTE